VAFDPTTEGDPRMRRHLFTALLAGLLGLVGLGMTPSTGEAHTYGYGPPRPYYGAPHYYRPVPPRAYYAPRPYYYRPPPVYYAPRPRYYGPPGITFGFNFR
jgi:hypothetical protein